MESLAIQDEHLSKITVIEMKYEKNSRENEEELEYGMKKKIREGVGQKKTLISLVEERQLK